jgi:hypothetical protein
MRLYCSLLAVAAAFAAPFASAHGPQIQITGESGQITTRRLLLDGPYSATLTAETSVYVMPLKEHLGVWYTRPNGAINSVTHAPTFFSGPGIAYGYGYDPAQPGDVDFTPGSQIRLAFAAGLKLWNGVAFADAGVTELESFRGSFVLPSATARTSDSGPFATLAYDPVNFATEGAEVHNTSRFRLLGDGSSPTTASPDGVYLLSLQLTSSQVGLASSDPFFFVLNKNSDRATVDAAVASLGVAPGLVQFVPEPGSATVALVVFAVVTASARRPRLCEGTEN